MSENEPAVDGVGGVGVDPVGTDCVDGAAAVAVSCEDAVGDSVTGEIVVVGVPVIGQEGGGAVSVGEILR
ncbi:hypothetical protein GN244_ATG09383 [Phytophthora infestans]|uniref:Uncharacterized protein n=1 Tax=Phytophthora infestans TaxID=4787 RepID=A0A833W1J4_PHYIN|nr:hypothetical protein GN244_ATG09383 [Phytophthora infestans]KAF4130019.1 hypothetical protein GN958_ATG20782 [Phytophthora infestans]